MPKLSNNNLFAKDLAHIWHPCTQMKDHEDFPIIPIKSAKGVYLYDFDDNAYIDCISSWWVNLFGHCNAAINAAITSQLNELEHILLAGFSHKPIIDLSQRLCALLPSTLSKCFYADNGSSAIEVALKMSFHYHRNIASAKPPRSKFLALSNAYHGETIGALSVGDLGLYKRTYEPILLSCLSVPVPNVFAKAKGASLHAPAELEDESYYEQELRALESILARYGEEICAFIIEPIIQCAGTMHIYPKAFIKKACELCKSYGVLIIFDEIAVGFGRSGSMFALEQCGVVPDFLCLSKGISGGYLPLSVVVTSDEIYQAFYAPYESNKAFLHSHSYTGNALACAAANAALDIFATQNIIEKNRALSLAIFALWQELEELAIVKNLRHCGMIFAFDLDSSTPRAGLAVFKQALQRGLLLRPLGNTIYFMPPYVITIEQAHFVVQMLKEILHDPNKLA